MTQATGEAVDLGSNYLVAEKKDGVLAVRISNTALDVQFFGWSGTGPAEASSAVHFTKTITTR